MTSTLDAAIVTVGPLSGGVEHVAWAKDGLNGPPMSFAELVTTTATA